VAAPLPHLPDAFGVTDDDARPGGPALPALVAADHARLERLCDLLAAGADRSAREVLVAEACRHLSAEEQYLHPAVRAVAPQAAAMADAELAADAALLRDLGRLRATAEDDPGYPGLVAAVTGQLRAHTDRARRSLLPTLTAGCHDHELVRLGNRYTVAREGTPLTPPANKVVDPLLAVADKVRDVLTGRPTRADKIGGFTESRSG
jgi:hypothetical protein